MGYLPTKNFVALVSSFPVVILAGYFGLKIWNSAPPQSQATNSQSSISFLAAYENANRDSDNDGLKDWEEILWKTDILKADTDDDGALDAEEIKLGRDPLVTGPDDFLKSALEQKSEATTSPQTLTEVLAKEFAANYFAVKGMAGGGAVNQSVKLEISNSLVRTVENEVATYRDDFTVKDISVSGENSESFIKTYINGLASALDNPNQNLTPEVVILKNILTSQDFSQTELFNPNISSYRAAVLKIKTIAAPASYKNLHLEILNAVNNTKKSVELMKTVEKDPAAAMIGLQLYLKQVGRIRNFLLDLDSQAEKDEISFSQNDAAYSILNNP